MTVNIQSRVDRTPGPVATQVNYVPLAKPNRAVFVPPTRDIPVSHYILVNYPTANKYETHVESVEVIQREFYHDIAVIKVRQPEHNRAYHRSGTPVTIAWGRDSHNTQTFYGYVHHVARDHGTYDGPLTVVCIGASYKMKATLQDIYKNVTDSDIVRRVVHNYTLHADIESTVKFHKQYAINGKTGWEVLKALAHASGFTLFCHQQKVYFVSRDRLTKDSAKSAPQFWIQNTLGTFNPTKVNVFKFEPVIDESGELAGRAKRHYMTIDHRTGQVIEVHDYLTPTDRGRAAPNILGTDRVGFSAGEYTATDPWDMHVTDIVARDRQMAQWRIQDEQQHHKYYIKARMHVAGNRYVHQGMPIYLHSKESLYEGIWYVSEVTHTVSKTGYTMHMEVLRDALGSSNVVPTARPLRKDPNPNDGTYVGTSTPEEQLAQDQSAPVLSLEGGLSGASVNSNGALSAGLAQWTWRAPYVSTRSYTVPPKVQPNFVRARLRRFK